MSNIIVNGLANIIIILQNINENIKLTNKKLIEIKILLESQREVK